VPKHTNARQPHQAIREATASDRLTLDEEYENQVSWRTSPDKLTFIVCRPLSAATAAPSSPAVAKEEPVVAGDADRDENMVGDINLFLTPWEDDEEEGGAPAPGPAGTPKNNYCVGEVDIMIADQANRGRGMGRAAVSAFLWFIRKNASGILVEYGSSIADGEGEQGKEGDPLKFKELLVRIKASNEGSIALFKGLDFEQRGSVNYFGEIEMVLPDLDTDTEDGKIRAVEGYQELSFNRSKLKN
jgi:hypothetical protein